MSVAAISPRLSAPWLDATLTRIGASAGDGVPYLNGAAAASEPTAIAALALAAHGHVGEARKAAAWLAHNQLPDGSIGMRPGEDKPAWPTSLALVSWHQLNADHAFDSNIAKATSWLLAAHGTPTERTEDVGHDTTLIGWSWAENTHSWLEPTAFAVLALTALGKREHARTAEAIRLMDDRLLASGGCNYGNTTIFGRELRPHIQPTGIVLLALAGSEPNPLSKQKQRKSTAWLESQLSAQTPAASLAWGVMGLRAQGVNSPGSPVWLAAAAERVAQRDHSPAKLALLALATIGWPIAKMETKSGATK